MLVFVGAATEDSIALVERYPGPDDRVVALDIVTAGGGPAATAAVAAARLGHRSMLVSTVGDDEAGAHIVAELAAEGVDTTFVRRRSGMRSARSVIAISRRQATRAIMAQPGPDIAIAPEALDAIAAASWVHVDHHGWAAARAVLDALSDPPRLSVDAGNEIPGYRQEGTALYVPTVEALERRYGPGDVPSLTRRAQAEGAQTVVASRGARGAVALAADGTWCEAEVPAVEVVSTLGAGDVFHGALLAGLAASEGTPGPDDLASALAFATTVAALSCRAVDGRSGIPDAEEAAIASARPVRESTSR